MKFNNGNFIGLFDSGIGGISVLNSCISLMPNENYIYFADSNNFPYGKKSKEELFNIGIKNLNMFSNFNAKEVIIACNTMTTNHIQSFKNAFKNLHLIGTYPDFINFFSPNTIIKDNYISLNNTDKLVINRYKLKLLIIATTRTCRSDYLNELINSYKDLIDIYLEPADFIVKAVENNALNEYEFICELKNLFKEYKDIDCLFLGCTHFPHATYAIRSILGDKVRIESGCEVAANNAYKYLLELNKLNDDSNDSSIIIIDNSIDNNKINLYKKLIKTNSEIVFKHNFEI